MPRPTDAPWYHRAARWIEHHVAWPVDRAPLDEPDHDPRPEDEGCPECHRLRQENLALEQRLGEAQEQLRDASAPPCDRYPDLPLHWAGPDGTRWSADADPMADSRPTIGTGEPGHAKAPEAAQWTPGQGWDSPKQREAVEHNRRRVRTTGDVSAHWQDFQVLSATGSKRMPDLDAIAAFDLAAAASRGMPEPEE